MKPSLALTRTPFGHFSAIMELEVETNLVLTRHIKLRVADGSLLSGSLLVYECDDPYVLVLTVTPSQQTFLADDDVIRIDIFKEDLSRELKHWLESKYIHHPAALVPVRVDEAIMKFIKFAKTPRQEDLIMWILSRCELHRPDEQQAFELVFGGLPLEDEAEDVSRMKMGISNRFSKTATIAAAMASHDDANYLLHGTVPDMASAPVAAHDPLVPRNNEDLGMFAMTRKLLGKSSAMERMKSQRVKGRDGARTTLTMANNTISADSCRVVNEIERTRKDIIHQMDERRRLIEIAKIRQMQSAEKYRNISQSLKGEQQSRIFADQARQELTTLQTIQYEIEDDMMKQKTRIQRGTQKVIWTKAPNGCGQLRGRSMKGPVLGPGPLPANATSSLKDPVLERTVQAYYWDQAGRRHKRSSTAHIDDSNESSIVEVAMEAIRKAAANISAFKLDLKAVFQMFDTSGDGFLSPVEMAQAFLSFGIKLDIPSIQVIFKHFDPNDSGSVHFGEFVWAFFNRRQLVRQWKRNTASLTKKDILNRFHNADTNGNGRLNRKEFAKLLKAFQVSLPDKDLEVLMDRFDVDGDGEIDLQEFYSFIESEQQQLYGTEGSPSPSPAPATRTADSSRPASRGRGSTARPADRPIERPPVSKADHNQTAPAALQKSAIGDLPRPRVMRKEAAPEDHEEDPALQTRSTTNRVLAEADDALWMSRMLQAQAEVEGRLGNRYFKTRSR